MELLTPKQLAKLLKITEKDLEQMRKNKSGPEYIRIKNGIIRYEPISVGEWIKERKVG